MAKYTLVGKDGNAWYVMSYVANAMKKEGFSKEEINEYQTEAMSGDYNNLLCVSVGYIEDCNERAYQNRFNERSYQNRFDEDEDDEDW